ncbi:hypothetical protein LZD49_21105 [Dyadobacter sp. CY261]|uniref:hypothetical protein n=1 Tax=Dyadobacter sp. CY261 TaxID=2907203 RepID=UPI001F2CE615|nr:hypothetical protein [Dyadobacter sp. CY261]MCF0072992.1 hypothetical protein [Dyadobacter sp. CY261]
MKKQTAIPEKLELVKYTVARLNGPSRAAGNKNLIDYDTTASTLLCRGFMI